MNGLKAVLGAIWLPVLLACSAGQSVPSNDLANEVEGKGRQLAKVVPNKARLARLAALPYVSSTLDRESSRSGVFLNHPNSNLKALNLYKSYSSAEVLLIDMEGEEVWGWHLPPIGHEMWGHTHLFPNGDILAVQLGERLVRISKDSKTIWEVPGTFHHDLWVGNEQICAIDQMQSNVPEIHPTALIIDDRIHILDLDGQSLEKISILDIIRNSKYSFLLQAVSDREFKSGTGDDIPIDLLHANHVEVFDGTLANLSPYFRKGNILLSVRNINSIFIVDEKSLEILWLWGPNNLTFQHHPQLLPNGRIIVFNNGLRQSTILEVDPLTNQITWRYEHADFFSETMGSVQPLPGGNLLVTNSESGYVFEVTREGERIWEFANPDMQDLQRGSIWRMQRFQPQDLPFLSEDRDRIEPRNTHDKPRETASLQAARGL